MLTVDQVPDRPDVGGEDRPPPLGKFRIPGPIKILAVVFVAFVGFMVWAAWRKPASVVGPAVAPVASAVPVVRPTSRPIVFAPAPPELVWVGDMQAGVVLKGAYRELRTGEAVGDLVLGKCDRLSADVSVAGEPSKLFVGIPRPPLMSSVWRGPDSFGDRGVDTSRGGASRGGARTRGGDSSSPRGYNP